MSKIDDEEFQIHIIYILNTLQYLIHKENEKWWYDKLMYNRQREDHKREVREKENGKKF